uniref:superoxide dismutase n=1 Tax=Chlamydomonas sp. ICE-L TaxID=309537 RepID=A0A7T3UYZ0_9CHLO|nr:superoxide dismutase [Chlamydomonas sp. ICE-L]
MELALMANLRLVTLLAACLCIWATAQASRLLDHDEPSEFSVKHLGTTEEAMAVGGKRSLLQRSALPGGFSRGFSPIKLPDLPYEYGALEPYISGQIMELHYSKHHKSYVDNLNKLMNQTVEAEEKGDLAKVISLQGAIKFNGGGHINHAIFWTNLCPPKDFKPPSGDLLAAIEAKWKSLENFQSTFSAQTAGVQGSGWGWLVMKPDGSIDTVTMSNQDPVATLGLTPLLGIDVWEHAYYLQYLNVRNDYLKQIWNVVNWSNVEERFAVAKAK